MVGAYVGAAVGGLLGMMLAPAPGPDDTGEFMAAIMSAAVAFRKSRSRARLDSSRSHAIPS